MKNISVEQVSTIVVISGAAMIAGSRCSFLAAMFEERQRIFEFNHSIGLPCTLGEIALTEEDVPAIAHKATSVVEWTYVPGEPTEEKFIKAISTTSELGLPRVSI